MNPDDLILPFKLESADVRGRLVRLGPLVDEVLLRHAYPQPVSILLGEMLVLAAAIARSFKFDGTFSLQTESEGPVDLMIADFTTSGEMRAYARTSGSASGTFSFDDVSGGSPSVPHLLGAGRLAFTLDQGPDTERYQGIVPLEGATLVDCAHAYLRQSEQLDAALRVDVTPPQTKDPRAGWRAGGIMIERLASDRPDDLDDEAEDDWRRALALVGSTAPGELSDAALAPEDLLYRLFHEDGVRVFTPLPLVAACRCSRQRMQELLAGFPHADIADMVEDEAITATCKFCNQVYRFAEAEIAASRDS
ncbi:MAG TPA: Hsp33 family molecular chaperone HslO [Alphaproteobacteria bacterium]|nr:Hsp33 family molecular chaperone HslO [Alphaproteobacteria bacterium]MDP6271969.1 Hsp33 family molecular chaperone HslO [Alphaproteobacteria bacterium]HJM51625.1 Hsp33 family molecular chaperone HslO [Alphaproteobacteria bacterium]